MARLGRSYPKRPLIRQYNMAISGQLVWFAVYYTDTGELFSVGSVIADPMPSEFSVLELARIPDGTVNWDTTTRTFVPRSFESPPVDRVADLLADATLTTAWAALSGPQSTAMQTRIGSMLGRYRYRVSSEPVDIPMDL